MNLLARPVQLWGQQQIGHLIKMPRRSKKPVMQHTFSELSPKSIVVLKQMCVDEGYKKPGKGWAHCCPPLGTKNDIIRRLISGEDKPVSSPRNFELSCAYYGTLWGL